METFRVSIPKICHNDNLVAVVPVLNVKEKKLKKRFQRHLGALKFPPCAYGNCSTRAMGFEERILDSHSTL